MNYLQFNFETADAASKEMLMAFLARSGFESFEEDENILRAYIKEDEFMEDSLDGILKIVPAQYTRIIIQPQNWNAQWESSFEPIIVNDFAGIRAAFHKPIQQVKHEIIITPKMSFGTGHHATTYLMIGQMANIDFTNKTVIDFGTGTAILSILAEKMGAAAIDAIDNDDWSIENSKENLIANDCSRITLYKADTILTADQYDIVLANINLSVILSNLSAMTGVSKKGSLILLSGFLKADEKVMAEGLSKAGITHLNSFQKGEWISMLCDVN
jgi:ribosomal protein L11 methyltransferase